MLGLYVPTLQLEQIWGWCMKVEEVKHLFYRLTPAGDLVTYEVNASGRLIRQGGLEDDAHGVEARQSQHATLVNDGYVHHYTLVLSSGRPVVMNVWSLTGLWMTSEACAKIAGIAFYRGRQSIYATEH
ncbi:MAG: hypothetical protein WAZ14_00585 [Patescibacteria group bacterium]